MSGGHGVDHGDNKKIGLFISVLALFLAVVHILGQKAQTQTIQSNIEASNLWSFFQAKTIRRTLLDTAADEMQASMVTVKDPAAEKVLKERIDKWRDTAKRYRSEPETGEGSEELAKRAKAAELIRDKAGKKHFRFELASGALQIAIVLAPAAVITGVTMLLWASGGLGIVGVVLLIAGLVA
jgi:Domain of unknown function (DUF4337)